MEDNNVTLFGLQLEGRYGVFEINSERLLIEVWVCLTLNSAVYPLPNFMMVDPRRV